MISLSRHHPDPFADEVEERLRELVVAHVVHAEGHTEDDAPEDYGDANREPPIRLSDGGRTAHGRDAVKAFVDELEQEVRLGRQFQSDACYLDPDDPTQCL